MSFLNNIITHTANYPHIHDIILHNDTIAAAQQSYDNAIALK